MGRQLSATEAVGEFMYCGHVGIALGAKGQRAAIPLFLLMLAAFCSDWFETVFIAAHVPHTALYSHSIPAVAVETIVVAGAAWRFLRSRTDALFVAAVCVSHLLLDWITGRKPLWSVGSMFGEHLYAHPRLDFLLEGATIVAGGLYYRRSLPAARRNDPALYLLLIGLLLAQGMFDAKFAK